MENLLKRFFRYVSVETTSDETSQSIPSTKGQLAFVHQLENELKELKKLIKKLTAIAKSGELQLQVVKEEITEIKNAYPSPRKSPRHIRQSLLTGVAICRRS